jgi:thymidylate synthase
MSAIEHQYLNVLYEIINHGTDKSDRTGTGTKSIFGYQIIHDMKSGFPLLTTKKMAWKSVVTELLWFLRGDTNIKFLHDNNCHIWDGDYNKSGRTDGELGPIYGKQWRRWEVDDLDAPRYEHWKKDIDQISNLINELKTNPDSRRLMVNAWNVGELDQMVLPPCHYGFQVYTRELSFYELRDKLRISNEGWFTETAVTTQDLQQECIKRELPIRAISLMWNQRSVDTFLGLPFNIASYALLLEIIAKEVNMIPDELIGSLGDVHLYNNHIEQAKEQLTREPLELPKLSINDEFWNPEISIIEQIQHIKPDDFQILNYQSHPAIKAPLSN